ncbi:predicted protein [Histoplasma capsulatum H143]|uniref:Uncharacterized protein n=1 Tax=Ajellomyces capsulatus (strain H143) TaxID=544712 RepID=C6HFK5_AJECH|nr:predicted protein [Histoplasma capsulatum H143]
MAPKLGGISMSAKQLGVRPAPNHDSKSHGPWRDGDHWAQCTCTQASSLKSQRLSTPLLQPPQAPGKIPGGDILLLWNSRAYQPQSHRLSYDFHGCDLIWGSPWSNLNWSSITEGTSGRTGTSQLAEQHIASHTLIQHKRCMYPLSSASQQLLRVDWPAVSSLAHKTKTFRSIRSFSAGSDVVWMYLVLAGFVIPQLSGTCQGREGRGGAQALLTLAKSNMD